MKYLVSKSIVRILAKIWMPYKKTAIASLEKELTSYDLENIERPISRETVEHWIMKNSEDFSTVIDFYASLEIGEDTITIPWESEENEMTYFDNEYSLPDCD